MQPPRPSTPFRRQPGLALLLAGLLLPAGPVPALRAQGRLVNVGDAAALSAAVAQALPGDQILLAPGDYALGAKLNLNRAGSPEAPIILRAEQLGQARLSFSDAAGVVEGLHVQAADWVIENLDIEGRCGDDSRCEHALHIVGLADRTVVRHCRLHGFNAQIKGNGLDQGGGKGWTWPDDVVIAYSEFFNKAPRQTGNPVTPVDVVGGRRWVLRGNYIHDHAKGGGDGISYAAFFKGNSRDGLMEQNLVVCEQLHRGRTRLGLSLGGGGSGPDRICEDGICSPEHQGGILRNNLILNCPADVGIYLNEAADSQVLHNTLYGTGGIDVRFAASSVTLVGNVMAGRIRDRDGGRSSRDRNRENVGAAQWAAWFQDPAGLDLRPRAGAEIVDAGAALTALPDDYCGAARADGKSDLGALELGSGCDPRPQAWAAWAAARAAAPDPGATPLPRATATGAAGATSTAQPTTPPPAPSPGASATREAPAPSATPPLGAESSKLWLPRLDLRAAR